MTVRLAALAVADEPAAWSDAGFAVDDAGRCLLGDVAVVLTPGTGTGVRAWAVEGLTGPVDGLPAIDLPRRSRPLPPPSTRTGPPPSTTWSS